MQLSLSFEAERLAFALCIWESVEEMQTLEEDIYCWTKREKEREVTVTRRELGAQSF